jgi:hypothetical protein
MMTTSMQRHETKAERLSPLAPDHERNAENYPSCSNISAGLIGWQFTLVPERPSGPPEYVHVPVTRPFSWGDEEALKVHLFATRWNAAWEAGHLRSQMFNESDVPRTLKWLGDYDDVDLRLIVAGRDNPYLAYEPLYHLLTLDTLHHCGLPPLRRGIWPSLGPIGNARMGGYLPSDFSHRLQSGFSRQLWPHLERRHRGSYSPHEPLVMLSNCLDFWLPYLDRVAQTRLGEFERVAHDEESLEALEHIPANVRKKIRRPLKGGDIWHGELDAQDAMTEMVEAADERGRLRGIVDAIRSNRVEDDFSARWSKAKADFERRLYHKRTHVKVSFVELDDTIPVHAPNSEPDGNLIWQDLLTLCDRRERQVVVCLRNGTTRATDIAPKLGYANHSPVSKTLARIRAKVAKLFDL